MNKKKRNTWYVSTKVDPDVDYSDKLFFNKVKKVLKHPRGWENIDNSINFVFVRWDILPLIPNTDYKIPIRLSSNKTIANICSVSKGKLSCCDMVTKQCWINFFRWMNGSKESGLSLYKYRNYVINHEVGHALGRLHAECPCINCSAPIMLQQTISIGACKPNDMPLINE